MTDYTNLMERLRFFQSGDWRSSSVNELAGEAADAILALTNERGRAIRAIARILAEAPGGSNTQVEMWVVGQFEGDAESDS